MLFMNNKKHTDFGQGSIFKLILRQAAPLTLSGLAQLLYSIIDRIYLGHIPGEGLNPLTGLGLTFPIVSMISAFTQLFGQGGSPLFSIARGEKNNSKAACILGNSFMMLFASSLILTLIGYIFMRPVIYAFGASDVTYVYARDYLQIYLAGTVFSMLATGLNYYISAEGYPGRAMASVMSGAVINLILDPIFIFALGLGIKGAAIATVISQAVSCTLVLAFFFGKSADIGINIRHLTPNAKICGKIISIGFTGFVMEITNSATQIVCNRSLRTYGGDLYITIMTIVSSIRAVMGVAVTGITSGASPVLGYNYGARNYVRVRKGIVSMALMAAVYTLFAWGMILLFPSFLIGLFSNNAEANAVAVKYLQIFFMAYVFMSFQFAGQSTFMALGKAPQAIFFSIFRKVVLVIPLTLILPLYLSDPVSGVFWAEPVSNIVGGLASFLTMYFTVYRRQLLGKGK